jgi:ubiquinol-cytochrome c reductase iron-sulfur subunit
VSPQSDPPEAARATERRIAAGFFVSMVAGIALLGVYLAGGQTQIEGVLLAICLGGIGAGIIVWSQRLLPGGLRSEERHPMASSAEVVAEAEAAAEEGAITRRTLLVRTLAGAFAGLAAALAVPALSLGPAPGRSLFETPWKSGLRMVGLDGQPINATGIPLGGVVTGFPEGSPGSADGQAILIHVGPGELHLAPDRMAAAPNGYVAFSKLCTHAGCPVGLYRASEHRLICPCHQSTFDVLSGAVPVFGPAARPLPQLPIRIDPDGTVVALGDFTEPVGPAFWNMTHG